MIFLESPSFDPCFNLALEEYVFESLPKDASYLMLWQNDNAVIVGKYQNTAREVNEAFVREKGIKVVRRLSGGGAVYHDLGNLNFTIITDAAAAEKINFAYFISPVVRILKSFGVDAVATRHNDITVNGAKFSGNAQYIKRGRVMHHGTILYDSDLSAVNSALSPNEDKFQDKAVQSVRSRVTNLKPCLGDVSLRELKEAFTREMAKTEPGERREFTPADIESARAIAASRYSTWEWNYGRSPGYQHEKRRRVDGVGSVDLFLSLEEGRLSAYKTRGDYFGEGDSPELTEKLLGCKLEENALRQALRDIDIGRFYRNMSVEKFIRLLLG
jgi:lipoate-protein ligase A